MGEGKAPCVFLPIQRPKICLKFPTAALSARENVVSLRHTTFCPLFQEYSQKTLKNPAELTFGKSPQKNIFATRGPGVFENLFKIPSGTSSLKKFLRSAFSSLPFKKRLLRTASVKEESELATPPRDATLSPRTTWLSKPPDRLYIITTPLVYMQPGAF